MLNVADVFADPTSPISVSQAAAKKLKSELSSDSREVMQVALPVAFGHPSPTQRGTGT